MKPVKLTKYIGMDVHKAMTVIVVLDDAGKVSAEAIIETKGSTILDFFKRLMQACGLVNDRQATPFKFPAGHLTFKCEPTTLSSEEEKHGSIRIL